MATTLGTGCGEAPGEIDAAPVGGNAYGSSAPQTPMRTGKADRATMDPEDVLSEGSGEHGVEEANQQDRILHRTLYAAAWAAQRAAQEEAGAGQGPRALRDQGRRGVPGQAAGGDCPGQLATDRLFEKHQIV